MMQMNGTWSAASTGSIMIRLRIERIAASAGVSISLHCYHCNFAAARCNLIAALRRPFLQGSLPSSSQPCADIGSGPVKLQI